MPKLAILVPIPCPSFGTISISFNPIKKVLTLNINCPKIRKKVDLRLYIRSYTYLKNKGNIWPTTDWPKTLQVHTKSVVFIYCIYRTSTSLVQILVAICKKNNLIEFILGKLLFTIKQIATHINHCQKNQRFKLIFYFFSTPNTRRATTKSLVYTALIEDFK